MALNFFPPTVRGLLLASALTLTVFAAAPRPAAAQVVTVVGARTGVIGAFTYTFDITNGTPATLAIVTLALPTNTTLTNFISPTGFDSFYDPGLGLVDFFEDTDAATLDTFAPGSTVGTFRFDSPDDFAPFSFTALDVNGATYQSSAVVFPGTTILPNAAAPEPGTLGLLALAAFPVAARFVRRRRAAV